MFLSPYYTFSFSFIQQFYIDDLLFIYSFTIYSFLRIFLLLLLQIISLEESRRNFLSPPSKSYPLPISNPGNLYPDHGFDLETGKKRSTYSTHCGKKNRRWRDQRIFRRGSSSGRPPGSLSARKQRGSTSSEAYTGRATTTERRTNERKSICMIHARERGRLEGGPRGRGTQGWVYIYIYVLVKGCRRGNRGEGRTESHSSPFVLPFAAN